MPLVEVIVGEDTSRGDRHRRLQLRPGDQEAADRLRRGARLRRQPDPDGDDRRDLARPGGAGPLDQGDRRGDRRRQRRRRWARSSSPTCSASTPSSTSPSTCNESYGETFYVHKGMKKLVADGKLGAKTGGEGFFKDGEQNDPRRRRARRRGAGRDVHLPGADRGLPAGRGGRLLGPRHRPRDDGRRRPRPAPRPAAAVLESRRRGPRHGARADRAAARRSTASASRRRCILQAPRRPGPPRARSPARASTPTRSPTRATRRRR